MTVEEKRKKLNHYCANCDSCDTCKLNYPHLWRTRFGLTTDCLNIELANENELDEALELLAYKQPVNEGTQAPQEPTVDMVNRPPHYCREGGMESIDEMVLIFGKEAVKNFCLCNVWKYRYRASNKNGEEDLKKSDWYIKKYKELCELGDTNA